MAQSTMEDLKSYAYEYESARPVGDVLIGEDAARPIMEASSSGNDTALQSMLSQPQWAEIMFQKQHRIYHEDRPSEGPNDARHVMAKPTSNLEWALTIHNGHAAVVPILLAFAKQQGMDDSDIIDRFFVLHVIQKDHAAVLRAVLASTDHPNRIANMHIHHGRLALYEAVKLRKPDVVAVLLEFGADPLRPLQKPEHVSLISVAAFSHNLRMVEMLLERGIPIANTGALHNAAFSGALDTMRVLIQNGADVNETCPEGYNWTPMHSASSKGQVEAIKLLEQSGARDDLKDKDGKTPAQLLEEFQNTSKPS